MGIDKQRYAVNIRLEEFGVEGQQTLLNSRLLIIGCGALGSTAAMYAAASGIGYIGLVDFDTVELSNLQRQVFFQESEAGKYKASLLAERIRSLNSGVNVSVHKILKKENAELLISDYDFVIDAADNSATTYLIEETCVRLNKSYVTAGVSGYHAQVMTHTPSTANFSDIFPKEDIPSDEMLPCTTEGVFGPLTGMIASMETSEAIKVLSGVGIPMTNQLLTIDLRTNVFSLIQISI